MIRTCSSALSIHPPQLDHFSLSLIPKLQPLTPLNHSRTRWILVSSQNSISWYSFTPSACKSGFVWDPSFTQIHLLSMKISLQTLSLNLSLFLFFFFTVDCMEFMQIWWFFLFLLHDLHVGRRQRLGCLPRQPYPSILPHSCFCRGKTPISILPYFFSFRFPDWMAKWCY